MRAATSPRPRVVEKPRAHELGAERRHVDAHVPELRVERAREVQDEPLGRRVRGEARLRHEGGHAGHVEDARARRHVRQRAVCELHGREHEQARHVRVVGRGHVREVAERPEAGVVDEKRHAGAGRLGERRLERVERRRLREVERERAHARGRARGMARDGPDLVERPEGALAEQTHELGSKAGRRPGDDCDAVMVGLLPRGGARWERSPRLSDFMIGLSAGRRPSPACAPGGRTSLQTNCLRRSTSGRHDPSSVTMQTGTEGASAGVEAVHHGEGPDAERLEVHAHDEPVAALEEVDDLLARLDGNHRRAQPGPLAGDEDRLVEPVDLV